MKTWIRSRARLKALYKLGLIESPDLKRVELPLPNFSKEKLNSLSVLQGKVLELRLIKGYSLEIVGREFDVTRETIRQKELEALQALLKLSRKRDRKRKKQKNIK